MEVPTFPINPKGMLEACCGNCRNLPDLSVSISLLSSTRSLLPRPNLVHAPSLADKYLDAMKNIESLAIPAVIVWFGHGGLVTAIDTLMEPGEIPSGKLISAP